MNSSEKYKVFENEAENRFEVIIENDVAYIDYKWYQDYFILLYIFVPVPFRGKSISTALIEYALKYARDKNVKIKIFCPYIAKYVRMHPEYQDLLAQA